MGAIAIQGPRAAEFIDVCLPGATKLKKNQVATQTFEGRTIYAARTGYTGEDGFEVIAPAENIERIWTQVLAAGHAHCAQPAGLGARDTLRTEMCYPLYGHELDENTSPIEAGLGFFVALEKGDFIGRSALAEQKAGGLKRKCIAFKMTEKSAPPRPHYAIWSTKPKPLKLGEVVSGTQSPSLAIGIGLGYVPPEFAAPGMAIDIEIRGKLSPAQVVKKPIYQKHNL
jgi:aminomethyltransferase